MNQQVTLKGNPVNVRGQMPQSGEALPDFTLTTTDLEDVGLAHFAGKRKLFNIFPSLDTPTCSLSVQRFNRELAEVDNLALIQVSADLPFAHARFCSAEDIAGGQNLSTFRSPSFLANYGLRLDSGPMAGLCARAVVVADSTDQVVYSELVAEIGDEPDYDAALAALKQAA
ncbi:thiol peroxidase [Salinisphaera sp. USBA-960]|uniref:thiol peroxidase n=1 Tax=Salinisphaera orenii TaxID=856731 RepID=UPI000DBE7DF9|nr:thiol peroxidase [Salifodinibacter halophilus]NNC26453.1 thiol peroxidase [Salifodinibacter halophilus]